MVESFEKVNSEKISARTIGKGDVVIVKIDQDMWDLDTASKFVQSVADVFTENDVLGVFKGVDLEIIRRER